MPKDKVSKVISLYENRKRFIHAVEKVKEINAEIFKGIEEIKKENDSHNKTSDDVRHKNIYSVKSKLFFTGIDIIEFLR